jgi:4-diphosphocytidyl-2-C-methyl-D-erythritol kinase
VIGLAPAKINLSLVVGPVRPDGKHELVTLYQRVGLSDRITLEPASVTTVDGFAADTLVTRALAALDAPHGWRARIEKHVPVAAGLGGGSSDAGTALRLANALLDEPFEPRELHEIAASLGSDVPFFLSDGPQLGTGDGSLLEPVELPQDFAVLLLLPEGAVKASTAAVYAAFDDRDGAAGYEGRATRLREALAAVRRGADLAALPANDLAASQLEAEVLAAGAFRAGVSGAGPALYGLFETRAAANAAARRLRRFGATWSTVPVASSG